MEKQVYRWHIIGRFLFTLPFVFIGCFIIFSNIWIPSSLLNEYASYIVFMGGGFLILALLFYLFTKNFTIVLDEEYITLTQGRWEIEKKIFSHIFRHYGSIKIKYEDIIAIYAISLNYPLYKKRCILVIPKPEMEEKINEFIEIEVKMNKEGKKAKKYYDWLITNHKGIEIPKWIKNYCELLKELHKKAPQSVLDDKIKKIIEK